MDLIRGLEEVADQQDFTSHLVEGLEQIQEEEEEKKLITVTREFHLKRDDCEVVDSVTTVKYSTMKPMSYFTDRHYQEHKGGLYRTTVQTIRPRKFYELREIENFVEHLKRMAGRTLEKAEIGLLLRHITRGEHYDLVCVIDETRNFEGQTVYEDIKK